MQTRGIVDNLTLQENQHLKKMASSSNQNANGNDSASIGANDFLTLLVTEMKNQDPTANTDPNEYINQLVQVNSLEQLISINQTLQSGAAVGDSVGTPAREGGPVSSNPVRAVVRPIEPQATTQQVKGNLSVPQVSNAAVRVAQSLTSH
jgi:flagellar basal-body rod modification protein FlgD